MLKIILLFCLNTMQKNNYPQKISDGSKRSGVSEPALYAVSIKPDSAVEMTHLR